MIRELKQEELPLLATIDKEVNPSCWTLSSYIEIFKHAQQHVLGVFDTNGNLAGGVVYSLVIDEAEILQLCISDRFQRQGMARELLKSLFKILIEKTVLQIFLEVRDNNLAAINLYHSLGFNIIAERKNYYRINGKTYDALIMAKTL